MRRIVLAVLLVTGAVLGSCATTEQLALQDDAACQQWGAAPGTELYAACRVQQAQTRAAQQQVFAARMAAAGRAVQSASGGYDQPSVAPTMGGSPVAQVCFKTGEQVSGFNKVCTYNCTGSGAALTVSSFEMCPMNPR